MVLSRTIHTSKIYRDDKRYHGDILFSRDSGFYNKPFYLSLSARDADIYYTLDGTEPDLDSTRYTSPIYIYDVTVNPNMHSARTDLSKYFYEDLIEKYGMLDPYDIVPQYRIPDYNVEKCMIIKAVTYTRDGVRGETMTGTYFVGGEHRPAKENILTVSLITDPDNLFDYDAGIYVTGRRFDDFLKNLEEGSVNESWYDDCWPANYIESGREWERTALISLFEGTDLVMTQEVGMRIQGGFSRELNPKSLNLYARPEYDGNTLIHIYQNDGICPSRLTVSAGGQDIYSKLRDPLVSGLCSGMDFATMSYAPCELYVDGEYWGCYFLTDRYGGHFLQNKYGVDDDNVSYVKSGILQRGSDEDFDIYIKDMDFISSADMTVAENYAHVQDIMDIESLIDYMAAETYIARWYDWPGRNYAMWRTRKREDGIYGDCRWRFMLYDVNWGGLSYDDGDAVRDTLSLARSESPLLENMLNNSDFRQRFIDRLMEMRDHEFNPDRVSKRIDEYVDTIGEAMENHYRRFFGTDASRFYEEADKLKLFFRERYDYIPKMIVENFEGYDYKDGIKED